MNINMLNMTHKNDLQFPQHLGILIYSKDEYI